MSLSRPELRNLVGEAFSTDADFDAFVHDHVPDVYRRFTDGMDRVRKTTILLEHADHAQLTILLRRFDPEQTQMLHPIDDGPTCAPPRPALPHGQLRVGLPPSLGADFVGRERALSELHHALHRGPVALRNAEARPGHVSAHGGGGIGKSRLAIEYAHEKAAAYPGGIFFTVAGPRAPLAIWADLARRHPQLFAGNLDHDEDAARVFAAWLADPAADHRLVVLDDVSGDDADELAERFAPADVQATAIWPLPRHARVSVLFTTRLRELPNAHAVAVPALDSEAARKLLLARSRRQRCTVVDTAMAQHLASGILGGHPLAIALAGAYLRKVGPGYTFIDYAQEVKKKGTLQALEEAADLAGHRIADHERSIVATYELSCSLLDANQATDALAWRILRLAACLAPNVAIDRPFIARLLAEEGEPVEKRDVGLATERLLDLSLLSPDPDGEEMENGDVVIHLLVAEYTRWVMGKGEWGRVLTAAVEAARRLVPNHYGDFWMVNRQNAYEGWEWLSPARETHLVHLWSQSESLGERVRGRLGTAVGDLSMTRGEIKPALTVYREALSAFLAAHDPSDREAQLELCRAHDRVGDVLLTQRDPNAALSEYRQAMEIRRSMIGERPDPQLQRDLLVSHDNIGKVRFAQGRLFDAQMEHAAGLAIAQQLAQQDPTNAQRQRELSVSRTRLGSVLRAEGDSAGALVEYRAAMDLRQRLAEQRPTDAGLQLDLSRCHIRVGRVLQEQGDLAATLVEYRKAMEIRERLIEQDPANSNWQAELAYSLLRMASTPRLQPGEALQFLKRAHTILSTLADASRLTFNQQQWLREVQHRLQAFAQESTPRAESHLEPSDDDEGSTYMTRATGQIASRGR